MFVESKTIINLNIQVSYMVNITDSKMTLFKEYSKTGPSYPSVNFLHFEELISNIAISKTNCIIVPEPMFDSICPLITWQKGFLCSAASATLVHSATYAAFADPAAPDTHVSSGAPAMYMLLLIMLLIQPPCICSNTLLCHMMPL